MPANLQIALLISLFVAGFLARRLGWLQPAHAGHMLKLVVNVGLPALFLADVSRIPLRADLISLPVCAVLIIVVTLVVSLLAGRALEAAAAGAGRADHLQHVDQQRFPVPVRHRGVGPAGLRAAGAVRFRQCAAAGVADLCHRGGVWRSRHRLPGHPAPRAGLSATVGPGGGAAAQCRRHSPAAGAHHGAGHDWAGSS